jgi:hypothetical protein
VPCLFLPVYRNASAAFLPVYRNASAAFPSDYWNASAAFPSDYWNASAAFLPITGTPRRRSLPVNRKRLAFLPIYRNASAAFLLPERPWQRSFLASRSTYGWARLVEAASRAPE